MWFFTDELDSWFLHSVVNNKLDDSDSPEAAGDILHVPVGESFTSTRSGSIHQPDGLACLSTVTIELVISLLTNLHSNKKRAQ